MWYLLTRQHGQSKKRTGFSVRHIQPIAIIVLIAAIGCGTDIATEFVEPERTEDNQHHFEITTNEDTGEVLHKYIGKCGKHKEFLSPNNSEFAETLWKCGYDNWGASDKTKACVLSKIKEVPNECVSCFAEMTECGASNCKMSCWNLWNPRGASRSDGCRQCTFDTCGAKFKACSGIDTSETPQLK